MTASRRRLWHAVFGNGARERATICPSCLQKLSKRSYASTATATAEPANLGHVNYEQISSEAIATSQQGYRVQCGIVLSRPPQITRDLTPFEKAFFLYQRRLNERLVLPFSRYHYFTRNTPVFKEWQKKLKERQTPAHEIGRYNAYGPEGWNDEVLIGAPEAETQHQVDAMLGEAGGDQTTKKGAETTSGELIERPPPRVTVADKEQDQRSLDRMLQSTLYLLVQTEDNRWVFPTGSVVGREGLRDAAERILFQGAGQDMNTWFVGNAPIGLYRYKYQKVLEDSQSKSNFLGEKVFFMKARIAAGQVKLSKDKTVWKDFRWLSRAEVEKATTRQYWSEIRRMLPRR